MPLVTVFTYFARRPTTVVGGTARAGSPRWDIEDECAGPSYVGHGVVDVIGEDDEMGPLPLSQGKGARAVVAETEAPGSETRHDGNAGGKSTPSTLSDDADDVIATELGLGKRSGRGGSSTKKRPQSRGGDSEEQETCEDGQDTKRKPRKSARLA